MNQRTIKALKKYKADLIKIKGRIQGKCSTETNRQSAKIEKIKSEYSSINDVEDAYAFGIISSRKRDEIISILSNNINTDLDVNEVYLDMIERDINSITLELNMLEE